MTPDVITFNNIMKACAKDGMWEKTLDVLDSMDRFGIAPNVVSFSIAMNACEKKGRWARALQLFEMMQSCGITPNAVSFDIGYQSLCIKKFVH